MYLLYRYIFTNLTTFPQQLKYCYRHPIETLLTSGIMSSHVIPVTRILYYSTLLLLFLSIARNFYFLWSMWLTNIVTTIGLSFEYNFVEESVLPEPSQCRLHSLTALLVRFSGERLSARTYQILTHSLNYCCKYEHSSSMTHLQHWIFRGRTIHHFDSNYSPFFVLQLMKKMAKNMFLYILCISLELIVSEKRVTAYKYFL